MRKVVVPKRMMGRYVAQGMMRMQMPGWVVGRTLRRGCWRGLLRNGVTGDTGGKHGGDDKGLNHGRYLSKGDQPYIGRSPKALAKVA
jgi:hypothetical protein